MEVNTYHTDPQLTDTDQDGISDYIEAVAVACLDPLNNDTDNDGIQDGTSLGEDKNNNGIVDFGETDPCNPDNDGDGLTDNEEKNIYGTDPAKWDTDGDFIPDGFEVLHSADPVPLDPLDAADGPANFDSDSNENFHEYWNRSDLWKTDPQINQFRLPGCYYWGEADGDGYIQNQDRVTLELRIASLPCNYSNVIPPNSDTQDLDADGYIHFNDLTLLKSIIVSLPINMLNAPESLIMAEQPGTTVAVGTTCHAAVGVRNQRGKFSAGFGVVFEVDPDLSTGNAVLLGGEGGFGGGRYDISGPNKEGGRARITLFITQPGEIYLRARIPECSDSNISRYSPEITLDPPLLINAR